MGAKRKKLKSERVNEAIGVILLLAGLFVLVSLLFFHPSDYTFYTSHPNESYRNITGIIGVYLAHYLNFTFGWSAYTIPALFLFWSSCFFLQKVPQKKWVEFLGIGVSIVAISSLFSLAAQMDWKVTTGGALGYFVASTLETYFGILGGVIISLCFLALALLLATDFLLYPLFERAVVFLRTRLEGLQTLFPRQLEFGDDRKLRKAKIPATIPLEKFIPPKVRKYNDDEPRSKKAGEREVGSQAGAAKSNDAKTGKEIQLEKEMAYENAVAKLKIRRLKGSTSSEEGEHKPAALKARPDEKEFLGDYTLPPLDTLHVAKKGVLMKDEDLHRNSKILEETLRDFGIQVKVTEVEQGPVITRYELLPAPGVKINRIVSLGDDLSLALKTTSVRFLTPIPGKAAMGIEIPNSSSTTVYLRELLESSKLGARDYTLPLMLGKDTSGKALIGDLVEMPHLLIAGATGSGKTVCLNSVITGLLFLRSPEQLRFIMVDPKMVELAIYKDIPHMMTPVVTDVRKAASTLNWLVTEMERRYRIFATVGTRNIKAFNTRPPADEGEETFEEQEIPKKLPYIILVIDELADLMLVSKDKVETAITRLAQLSRAVGIHLILATQRPSVDVITGVIKANFPARISFKVSSKVDSRTVLDTNGADKLIGKGDMLFLEPGEAKPTRGQGTLIMDEEIAKCVKFIKKQKEPQYLAEIAQVTNAKTGSNLGERDDVYHEAVQMVLETKQASVSVLQRRLRLGYARAARLIDMMEEDGVVGPHQGYKAREILVDQIEETTDSSVQEA